jgi:hypothetical protein
MGWRSIGAMLLLLSATDVAFQVAFALDDTYLRCKGTITILYESGVQSFTEEEIAVHVVQDRLNFSGSHLLKSSQIQICNSADDVYFDSQTCKEGAPVDLSRPREYGTLNKITGELHFSNEAPKRPLVQGSFVCRRVEPVVK